jgi:hypothetical protein
MTRLAIIVTGAVAATGIAAAVALACGACGPTVDDYDPPDLPSEEGGRYAEALCKAVDTCGCALPLESGSDCEGEYHARFDKLLEAGFVVASECFEGWLGDIGADPCDAEIPPPGDPFPCASLRGGKKEGEACKAHVGLIPLGADVWPLRADECGDGLSCLYAKCTETPAANDSNPGWDELAEGEACGATYLVGFCSTQRDLYCDLAEGVCRTRRPLGDACSAGECEGCSADGGQPLFCQGATATSSGTCAPTPRIGEPCDPGDMVACGGCGDVAWCDPASSTCVDGRAPRLCSQISYPAP